MSTDSAVLGWLLFLLPQWVTCKNRSDLPVVDEMDYLIGKLPDQTQVQIRTLIRSD